MNAQPLVSCIMPTADRRAFVPRAIAYFQRQDYTTRELIVVDDGDDAIGDLIPADERIRHIRVSTRMTVGAKRNLACEQARGEVIAHWDDDDWHAPHRLNRDNLGSSIARNQIIDYTLACDADYLLLMDGYIEIVPFSSFAMLRYMENSGHRLGCIGADSLGQTPHRERASPYLYSVDGCRLETTNLVAWTQYGMFRRAIFDDGVRFDETRPFDGAGWALRTTTSPFRWT